MLLDLRGEVLGRLIAADPQLSLEETLRVVVMQAQATRGGVFSAQDSVELLAGCGVTQEMLDRVRGAWARERKRLSDGRPVCDGRWSVWPVVSAGGLLLVYVASDGDLRVAPVRDAVTQAGEILAAAARIDEPTEGTVSEEAVDRFLEVTSRDAIERRQLMTLLNRHEWNIARVGRALACNRVTVYKRMRRLGIPRLRVCRNEAQEPSR
jgi:DNA-directed RNA polymerase specialized sigma24 family protein